MNKIFLKFLAIIFALIPCTSNSIELHGVGRRIPAAIFSDWAEHYAVKSPATVVKYKAVNATEGIKQVEIGSADFGETDWRSFLT
jgi:ABC-type phosphate transport system substrate-binding protein